LGKEEASITVEEPTLATLKLYYSQAKAMNLLGLKLTESQEISKLIEFATSSLAKTDQEAMDLLVGRLGC
jgi:hypothetical protein